MGHAEVPIKDIKTGQLIEKLTPGWSAAHAGLAQELINRWAAAFDADVEITAVGTDTVCFTTVFKRLYLRSMDDVRCLLVGGAENVFESLQSFWYRHSSQHHLPFILAISEAAYATAKGHFSNNHCLILSAHQLRTLLNDPDPLLLLKRLLLKQIPKRTLAPYNILMPAHGVTFFGRGSELRRLLEEDFVSFAIAGPGRIGKTSLVMKYRAMKLRQRKSAAALTHYVSFYQSDATADGAARFLAKQIESTRWSDRVTAGEIVNFLRYRAKNHGGPLDLILDEVDEVCHASVFKFLGEAARLGYCRLILCGRGTLLKTALRGNSPIEGRLDLIQLEPLGPADARALLLNPLLDLGFAMLEPESLVEEVMELSGRLPHHIQMFGMKLVEFAIAGGSNTVSVELIEKLKGDLLVAQFFIRTLTEIRDAKARLVGLALLADDARSVSIPHVVAVSARHGLSLTPEQANDVCLDLAVNNVLAWEQGEFHIANRGLTFFTRRLGYLSSAIEDAKREVNPPAGS